MSFKEELIGRTKFAAPLLRATMLGAALMFFGVSAMPSKPVMAANTHGISSIALNPDESVLYAGGSNLVVYKIDPNSMKVVSRHWVKIRPSEMNVTSDGKFLIIQDNRSVVRIFDAKTMKLKKKIRGARRYAYAAKANKIVVADSKYEYKEKKYYSILKVIDGATFKVEKKHKILGQAAGIAVDAEGTTVSIVTDAIKTPEEKRANTTSDMSAAERAEFRQKHDARTSQHVVVSIADGEKSRSSSWFSFYGDAEMVRTKDSVVVLPQSTGGFMLKDGGDTTFINTGGDSQRGSFYQASENRVIMGISNGIAIKNADDEETTVYKLKKLPNYDYPVEIIKGKEAFFASTRAFRVIKFDPVEGIDTTMSVY